MTNFGGFEIDPQITSIIQQYSETIPVKVGQIARELGLGVFRSTLHPGISGQIEPSNEFPSGYVIKVNRHEAKVRQRFTIAHEIGHYVLHRDKIGNGIRDTILYRSKLSNSMEAEANRFAASLLMPISKIKISLAMHKLDRSREAAKILADEYEVSVDAMEIRLGLR